VTLQARAASLCAEMEMPRDQVLNLHVLGGYLLAGQVRPRAREVYARAGEIARKGGFADLESQSELALGMLEALNHRPAEAAAHYSTAGRLAEEAKVDALAIECWRMAGQLALEARLEPSAIECWRRALSLAEPLPAKVAQLTSAAESARALAAVCRKRGLVPQAVALERQALDLEQGAVASWR
jgi:tetratricopeptide (TPR) repeat protein